MSLGADREGLKPSRATRVQGARRAGTAVYIQVHEDSEHRATKQSVRAAGFKRLPDLQVELDALRQRQRFGVVDGVGLSAHVHLPRIRARLAAATGFLFTTESATDLGDRKSVV